MRGVDVGWIVGSGLATGIGGLLLLIVKRPSPRLLDALSGFTAGVMLAATAFSLLVPALELGTLPEILVGLAAGGGLFAVLDIVIPHAHGRFAEREHPLAAYLVGENRRAVMLLSALTLHNIPEGMAVGVAFAAGGPELGIPLALAIGIQNVPEGFAAAAPLVVSEQTRPKAAGVAAITGVVEPPSAFAAFFAVGVADVLLPLGLAFAAGAMLYVIVDELIPEAHAGGNERVATLGVLAGFMLMMGLDNAFA
jgi:ZIP family zinc transporter